LIKYSFLFSKIGRRYTWILLPILFSVVQTPALADDASRLPRFSVALEQGIHLEKWLLPNVELALQITHGSGFGGGTGIGGYWTGEVWQSNDVVISTTLLPRYFLHLSHDSLVSNHSSFRKGLRGDYVDLGSLDSDPEARYSGRLKSLAGYCQI
jgi:hypothetical protein